MEKKESKNIYIILTQTGTFLSRVVKMITGAKYSHVSIATDKELSDMYSFGRRHAYNPFWAGFVKESMFNGTFKRFKNTDALVMEIAVTDKQYEKIKKYLKMFNTYKKAFGYNFKGLFYAWFGKSVSVRRKYYCSEFVKAILVKAKVANEKDFPEVTQPIHFFTTYHDNVTYIGKLSKYPKFLKEQDSQKTGDNGLIE